MRYLHLISSMDPRAGGPCQGVRNLTSHSLAEGNTVEVVCLDEPDSAYLAAESRETRAASANSKAEIGKAENRGQRAEVGSGQRVVSNETADAAARASLSIHALGKGRGSWCYHPALRPWLEQNLHRFDAVILNGLWQYPGFVLSQLARKLGDQMPPYFVFPHGMLDPWFQRAPERRWKAIRNWFYWKLIERHVIARAAAVFFTCAEEMRLAQFTFRPYRPQREINVGYGVSQPPEFNERMVTAFAEKCPGLNGRPYFLYLSRIHPKKGVDILIQAYARVYGTQDHGTTDSETEVSGQWSVVSGPPAHSDLRTAPPALVIAGPGLDSDYGKEMQRLAAELGLMAEEPQDDGRRTMGGEHPTSNIQHPTSSGLGAAEIGNVESGKASTTNSISASQDFRVSDFGDTPPSAGATDTDQKAAPAIFFPGMLTGDAKWGALYRADAFVLTSHQENFGIAVVEALACVTPVLISNQINIWREIAADGAGLVADDTLAGAEQLFRRWESLTYEARVAMTRAAQASFLNRFGVANAAQNLLATMEKLVAARKAQRADQ